MTEQNAGGGQDCREVAPSTIPEALGSEALRAGGPERLTRGMMNYCDDGIYWLKPALENGRITDLVLTDVNDSGAFLMRLPASALVGQPLSKLLRFGAEKAWLTYANAAWVKGSAPDWPLELRDHLGLLPTRWFRVGTRRSGDSIVAVAREETQQRRLQRQLHQANEQRKQIEAIAKVGSWSYDLRRQKAWWSEETHRILGRVDAATDGRIDAYLAAVHPDDRETLLGDFSRTLNRGEPFSREHRVKAGDGYERIVNTTVEAILDERGIATDLVGTVHDLTGLYEQQEQMRASDELRRRVLDSASIICFSTDADGVVHYCEGRGLARQNLSPEDVLGNSIFDLYAGYPDFLATIRRALSGESLIATHETRGAVFERRLEPTWDEAGNVTGLIGVSIDVSDQHRTQEALERNRRLLHTIIDTMPARIMATDAQARVVLVNQLQGQAIGLTPEEAIERGVGCPELDPQEKRLSDAEIQTVLETGTSFDHERSRMDETGTERTERILRVPLCDPDGTVTGALNVAMDITEQKKTEQQLRHAQKMEAVGQLAGGVAHDFNNLLQIISGYGEIALRDVENPEKMRQSLKQMLSAADRASSLTRQLLAFSRRQLLQPRTIDLNGLIDNLMKMISRLLGETIELEMGLCDESAWIHADPGMIEQVLVNLSVNARDAMRDGGRLKLETHTIEPDEAYRRKHGLGDAERYVVCTVSDNGAGISEENLQRVFEPFFSTKPEHEGTGLGLSIAYGIVQQHDGQIRATSSVGEGSTFTVWLPEAKPKAEPAKRDSTDEECLRGRGETILVVEDEPSVLELLADLLQHYGYSVLTATNGTEGLETFGKHCDEIDVVVLDVVMPNLSGREVAVRIRQQSPHTAVLLSTGYAADIANVDFIRKNGLTLLEKPYSPIQLLQTVRGLIETGRGSE